MRKILPISGAILVVFMLCLSLGPAYAEDAAFSEAQLDQMVAPIALYPDSLLAQILMAATYPADVAEAVQWSKANSKLEGDAAVEAVQDKSWDPSVMSLVAFPQVLTMAGEQPEWVQNLGDAFLADSNAVMDTVQKLRKKAQAEGNLKTTEQQKIIIEQPAPSETVIVIQPANPQVVYVPSYNPTVVYGPWWWPRYTPYYYQPVGYGFGSAVVAGIGFGVGIGVTHALWGGTHWGGHGHNNVNINVNKYNNVNINRNKLDVKKNTANWNHNSNNRRGVPYRDQKSRDKFDNKRSGAKQRNDYRGRDSGRNAERDKARSTLNKRAVDPAKGRQDLKGAGGNQARDSVKKANRDVAQGKIGNQGSRKTRDAAGGANRDRAQRAPQKRDSAKARDTGSGKKRPSNNALQGSGNAKRSRQSINRGNSSRQSMGNRGGGGGSRGGSRGGGGGRGGGGRGGGGRGGGRR